MDNNIFIIRDLNEIHQVANDFLKATKGITKFAFHGSMGAGKTTFIKAICEVLGVENQVTSPTFALINEYEDKNGTPIYHFDFYRVSGDKDIYDIGGEEYFDSDAWCFVEWPKIAESILPLDICQVSIEEIEDGQRKITIL